MSFVLRSNYISDWQYRSCGHLILSFNRMYLFAVALNFTVQTLLLVHCVFGISKNLLDIHQGFFSLGWNASISPICAISEIKFLFRSQTLHNSSLLEFLESCPMNVKPQICQEPNIFLKNSCSSAFFSLVPYFQNFSQFSSSVSSALCDWLHFTFVSGRLEIMPGRQLG